VVSQIDTPIPYNVVYYKKSHMDDESYTSSATAVGYKIINISELEDGRTVIIQLEGGVKIEADKYDDFETIGPTSSKGKLIKYGNIEVKKIMIQLGLTKIEDHPAYNRPLYITPLTYDAYLKNARENTHKVAAAKARAAAKEKAAA